LDYTALPMKRLIGGTSSLTECCTTPFCIRLTPTEIARVESLIRQELGPEANGAGRWLFLLNPNASDLLPIRKWPTENFLTLAKRILTEFEDSYELLTGAPSEHLVVQDIAALISHPRCASVAGKTSLRELFALYSVSDILVTNDSGPGHFASMTPVDSIVLFGPETPALFGPRGESSHAVWNQLGCSPCVSPTNHRLSPCDDAVCMKSITVAQVWSIMENKLKSRQRKAEPYFINLSLPEYSINQNPTQPVLQ
jgi:ADP-heptose:LPS heptosyltransferase